MRLKKKVRVFLIIILFLAAFLVAFLIWKGHKEKPTEVEEVKVINQVEKYGYNLKENKPEAYKKMFEELKEILNESTVDEEAYAKKIAEMFVYDFYSLEDKTAKTDIGGVEFISPAILEDFLQNAQDTYYKYIESNVYNNRKQKLQVVKDITIDSIEKQSFTYGDTTDENAYIIKVSWDYTDSQFSNYQKSATLVFIHEDIKLYLVELQ